MIIDKLENAHFYFNLSEKISVALKYLQNNNLSKFECGRYDIEGDDIYVLVQDYNSKSLSEGRLEAHKKYIDIQYILEGVEKLGYAHIEGLTSATEYDEAKDIMFFNEQGEMLTAEKGTFLVFAPQDAHMPGIQAGISGYVKKAVIKIKV